MIYTFECPEHGEAEIETKVKDYSPTPLCPKCNKPMERVYKPIGVKWNCSGDYNSTR